MSLVRNVAALSKFSVAGFLPTPVSCSNHSQWRISSSCTGSPKMSVTAAYTLHSSKQIKTQTEHNPLSHIADRNKTVKFKNQSVVFSFPFFFVFHNQLQLEEAHICMRQLLFNICCKQQVSRGMRRPSPFFGSSQALLCTTSMLLFIGCNVGCGGQPQPQRKCGCRTTKICGSFWPHADTAQACLKFKMNVNGLKRTSSTN